jgi:hypothetical protein
MTPIGVVTSIPTDPPKTGAAAASFESTVGLALEFTGKASAGAGTLTLLRWFSGLPAPAWRPWKEDRPIVVDSARSGGFFSGVQVIGQYNSAHWLLLSEGGATIDDCYCAQADYKRLS